MDNSVKINDVIALTEDVESEKLLRGRLGRVLQLYSLDEFEVEFVNDYPQASTKIPLKREQFTVLGHQATLGEDDFWKLIEESKQQSNGDGKLQVELLTNKVAEMPLADIFAYDVIFHKIHSVAYRADLWAAAYIIGNGCSDDGFKDFRAWLIAQGKQIFYDALADPEILVDHVPIIQNEMGIWGDAQLEEMNYIAYYAYEKKLGEEIPIFPGIYTSPELIGNHLDDDTAFQKYPKLTQKYWEQEGEE